MRLVSRTSKYMMRSNLIFCSFKPVRQAGAKAVILFLPASDIQTRNDSKRGVNNRLLCLSYAAHAKHNSNIQKYI